MEEILHHLGCINPVNNGINYQPQLVIAGFQPSTEVLLASALLPEVSESFFPTAGCKSWTFIWKELLSGFQPLEILETSAMEGQDILTSAE